MKSSASSAIYNLKAVVQETGLKPDTLRAWERRYGLPNPERTESGHRLYSQNDIELLKWLMARQEEGMSISRAVELWRRLQTEEQDPLQVLTTPTQSIDVVPEESSFSGTSTTVTPTATPLASGDGESDMLRQLRERWIANCLHFDERLAEQVVTEAFSLFAAEKVFLELFQRGLAEIGQGWYEGKITVQQEHFASALAIRRLETMVAGTAPPTRPGRILIGCPPEEVHTFVPLLLSLLLRRRGWDVIFLGANVPIQDFVHTIETAKPQFVILTAQLLFTAAGLRELGELIYQVRVPMGYGGLIFTQLPALQERVTGHYLGDSLDTAVERIEQMMMAPHLPLPVVPLTTQEQEALTRFRQNQARIEAIVWQNFADVGLSHSLLRKANINFARDIIAALTLGDIRYLAPDLQWIKGLLTNHYQMPEEMVMNYLATYLRAAEEELNGQGLFFINWLEQILQEEQALAQKEEVAVPLLRSHAFSQAKAE